MGEINKKIQAIRDKRNSAIQKNSESNSENPTNIDAQRVRRFVVSLIPRPRKKSQLAMELKNRGSMDEKWKVIL